MIMILIGIFDRKAQCFISLEPTPNIAVSVRQLTENVNKQSDSPIYKWPEDYSLWELGKWNNETGLAEPRAEMPEEPYSKEHHWQFAKKLVIECESLKQRS